MFAVFQLAIRFVLELILFLSLAYWGFKLDQSLWVQFAAGLGLPIAAAVVWGKLISPKRSVELGLYGRLGIELLLMAGAFVCLYDLGFRVLAIVFAVVEVLNRALLIARKVEDWPYKVE
ncbi:YrdB family protein [Paenibacillus sp. NPDC058071]|uniref:YrdB family protein n=1 Tax=Paenibacillus sp. NPDC058071 TaxID=3346326 RepID=UPI0036D9C9B7